MRSTLQQIVFSFRQMVKSPMNTVLCIFVLAGGIAIVMSMMRLCQQVFYSKVPYKDSDRMYIVERLHENGDHDYNWPVKTFRQWEKNQTAFSDLIVEFSDSVGVLDGDVTNAVTGLYVSYNFSEVTGISPILGRPFEKRDALGDAERVVIINEKMWREMFGASKSIIGKPITVDGVVRTIIGVMPESFDGPFPMTQVRLWIPLNYDTLEKDTGWGNIVTCVGKLHNGESAQQAKIKTDSILKNVSAFLPDENRNVAGIFLDPVNRPKTDETGEVTFKFLFLCSLLVLFMACAIASGLMNARYSARAQEFAIRSALGATRRQLVVQMVAEFLLISILATVLGLLLYNLFVTAILDGYMERFNTPPFMRDLSQTGMMMVAIPLILIVVTLSSVLFPAIRASRVDISSVLRESTRTGSSMRITRMSNFIIVWQIATACVVLGGGAMMGYMLYAFRHQIDRYDPSEYICVNFSFSPNAHSEVATRNSLAMKLVRRVESDPDFSNVALSNELYNSNSRGNARAWIEGKTYASENEVPLVNQHIVTPGYFAATNIPILYGRDFTEKDDAAMPVAVVTDIFAKKYYGTMDVLGKRFKTSENGNYMTIVGIVPDTFTNKYFKDNATGFYVPYAAQAWMDMVLLAKTRGDPSAHIDSIVKLIGSVDNRLIISDRMSMKDLQDSYQGGTYLSFLFTLFGICSIAALIMSAAGLFGIISFSVNMRRLEIGIRMAIGEVPMGAVMLIVKRGVICMTVGMIIGILGLLILRHFLLGGFGAMPESVTIYCLAECIVIVISAFALLVPAVHAAFNDPFKALHEN
jgi:predicted permease